MNENLKKKFSNWLIVSLLIVGFIVYSQVYYIYAEADLVKVWFLDVGQGDSILIDFGDNKQALIDGGPSKAVLSQLGQYLPIGDKKIEYLILTHPDSDHVTGLNYVLDEYEVGKIYHTGIVHETNRYQEFREKIKDQHSQIAKFGDVIRPNDKASLKILFPLESYNQKEVSSPNNTSIVAQLKINNIDVLLTGDGEEEVWQKLADKNLLTEVEVLKVSHHGAKNGTTELLLDKTKPEVAIISAGANNRYGHPSQDVLDLLTIYGLEIYRTDELGTIKLISDGYSYEIK